MEDWPLFTWQQQIHSDSNESNSKTQGQTNSTSQKRVKKTEDLNTHKVIAGKTRSNLTQLGQEIILKKQNKRKKQKNER